MNPRYSRYYTFIKPILRNTQVRTYSSLVFSLIAIAVFSIFAIKPTISTIIGLQKSIKEQQQVFDTLKLKAQNLSLGKKNLADINPATKDKLYKMLPDKTDPTQLITSLNTLASNNEASVSGLQFQPSDIIGPSNRVNRSAPLKELTFTFNVSGSYQKLTDLLNAMSASPRLISIDSVSLNQTETGLVMSINAKAYFLDNNQ